MQHPRSNADRDPAATWMQKLAALPSSSSTTLPSPEVLWWQAQALRRLDEQRRLTAKLEIGERIQVGCLIVAALMLLAWMLNRMPGLWQLPAYVLGGTACTLLMAIVAVIALSGERGNR
jgi:hypothetical protein